MPVHSVIKHLIRHQIASTLKSRLHYPIVTGLPGHLEVVVAVALDAGPGGRGLEVGDESATRVDAAFASSRSCRLVPGIGTIWRCWASSQTSGDVSHVLRRPVPDRTAYDVALVWHLWMARCESRLTATV